MQNLHHRKQSFRYKANAVAFGWSNHEVLNTMLSLHELQYHNFGTHEVRWQANVRSLQRQHDWLSAVTWQRYTVNEWAAPTSGSCRVRWVEAPPSGLHVTWAHHYTQADPRRKPSCRRLTTAVFLVYSWWRVVAIKVGEFKPTTTRIYLHRSF